MNERIRIREQETLSDDWFTLRKITFDYQRKNGTWETHSREAYDRGNGAAILLHNPATDLPAANALPTLVPAAPSGTPAQQAFRQAILDVENLRERLRDLRTEQAEARRRYWQQVGPAATAVVPAEVEKPLSEFIET